MSKDIEIRITNSLLVVPENELLDVLSTRPGLLEESIKKGKYFLRNRQEQERQDRRNAENFDRWQIYELLKSDIKANNDTISFIEGMDSNELREGVIEFLLMRNRR